MNTEVDLANNQKWQTAYYGQLAYRIITEIEGDKILYMLPNQRLFITSKDKFRQWINKNKAQLTAETKPVSSGKDLVVMTEPEIAKTVNSEPTTTIVEQISPPLILPQPVAPASEWFDIPNLDEHKLFILYDLAKLFNKMDRTYLAIDGKHLFSLCDQLNKQIDYSLMQKVIQSLTHLVTSAYYIDMTTISPTKHNLINWLNYNGYRVKANVSNGKFPVNINICIDLLSVHRINHVILIAGDEDLAPLIIALRSKGIFTTIISLANMVAKDLAKAVDNILDFALIADLFTVQKSQ